MPSTRYKIAKIIADGLNVVAYEVATKFPDLMESFVFRLADKADAYAIQVAAAAHDRLITTYREVMTSAGDAFDTAEAEAQHAIREAELERQRVVFQAAEACSEVREALRRAYDWHAADVPR